MSTEIYPLENPLAKEYYKKLIDLLEDMHGEGAMSLNDCREVTFKLVAKSTNMITEWVENFERLEKIHAATTLKDKL